ncbi:efflux RND transporter periplasmic adaptor subunit [Blastopirellula sp. J2-11]|uniref:efflux RND transporter periplasmic adaptor subunit n=1 Tax=Blastopirellula sp. J2-11 TaxID=2943192 RepID=UPI0021C60231|nr:efflux RND transporter periplasmic adaptor subunit [Blastopirellula sp. J2-11]UUO06726.1 efflux RND transporter periplasmic adaptor subunit [Blastopirellula sp. J2-11]
MPKAEPPPVTVAESIQRKVIDFEEYTGSVEAEQTVDVYAKISGYMQSVKFNDGAMVKAGELLFLIDTSTYKAQYDQAVANTNLYKAKYELAKTTLARNDKLVGSGAISQELYDESVAAVNESDAAVKAAEAQAVARKVDLDYCTITAAIDGRIDRTYVTKGNLVQGGAGLPTLLTTIVSVDPTYIYFDVDELALLRFTEERVADQDMRHIPLRDRKIPIQITLADGTIYPELGVVDFGSNQLDAGTGTISIRAVISNKDEALAPGMFVRVKVASGRPYDAVLVPDSSIGADQSDRYVYIVDDKGNAQRRQVTLGTKQGKDRVITSGLKAGEKVIINGLLLVRPGKPVVAQEGKMDEPPAIDPRMLQPLQEPPANAAEPKAEETKQENVEPAKS